MMHQLWFSIKGAAILAMRRCTDTPPGVVRRVLRSPAAAARHYGWSSASDLQVRSLGGAHVHAQPGAIVGSDGALLWSHAPQLTRGPLGAAAIWRRPSQPKKLSGKVLYAAADGFSYYHWLLGVLPKLLATRQTFDLKAFDRIIVNPRHKGARNFQTETFSLLGIEPQQIIWLERGTHVVTDELYLPPEAANDTQTIIKPWALQILRDQLLPLAAAHDAPPGPEKMLVSRANARRRRLVNEADAMVALQDRGFEAVTLEDLPLLTQIKWFSTARCVVGLHGAGLANLAFCQPGAQIVEFMPEAWPNACFEHLATAVSGSYAKIPTAGVGPRRGFGQDQILSPSALAALAALFNA